MQVWTSSQHLSALSEHMRKSGAEWVMGGKCKDHSLGRTSSEAQIGQFQESTLFCISLLAWKIPWMEEPGGLPFMGLHKLKWLSSSSSRILFYVCSDKMVWAPISLPVGISTVFINQHAKLLQSCPTFCNPMDCSLPGSSVHGILQARILLQGIFPIQESDPCLLHWQVAS